MMKCTASGLHLHRLTGELLLPGKFVTTATNTLRKLPWFLVLNSWPNCRPSRALIILASPPWAPSNWNDMDEASSVLLDKSPLT